MIDAVTRMDRRLRISHNAILNHASPSDRELGGLIDRYIDEFCRLRGLSEQAFLEGYTAFVARFTEDMKRFKESGRYPFENSGEHLPPPPRLAYDAALLLSVLVSAHRFRIFKLLYELDLPLGRTAIIGAGPGLELAVIAGKATSVDVFDLAIDDAMVRQHPNARFHREAFRGGAHRFDTILAIELLEHVGEPYDLLRQCHDALEGGGHLVATTATNIPQFDHTFNFVHAEEFEQRVRQLGFTIARNEPIVHSASFMDLGARNNFYLLVRPA